MPSLSSRIRALAKKGFHAVTTNHRRKEMKKQLPDAIRLFATSMSAGHTVPSAMAQVAKNSREPMHSMFEEIRLRHLAGEPLSQLLQEKADAYPSEEMELFVTTMVCGQETGRGLKTMLLRIEKIAIGKQQLQDRVQSITSQGRLQGITMAALPLMLILSVHWVDPEFLQPFWQTGLGKTLLLVIAIMNGVGLWWIRKITRISV